MKASPLLRHVKTVGLAALLAVWLGFNAAVVYQSLGAMRLKRLAGSGFNLACSQPDLSAFDRSVCRDRRATRLFLVYLDGAPFDYYQDLLTDGPFAAIATAQVTSNLGINDSGPAFRSALIGRYDIDFADRLDSLDNHFHQYLRAASNNVSLMVQFQFPVVQNLGRDNFAKWYKLPAENDGPVGLCPDLLHKHDHASAHGCLDALSCHFDSRASAIEYVRARTRLIYDALQAKRAAIYQCLAHYFEETVGFMLYQEKTDDTAHTWSYLHKITAELHASTRANLFLIMDFLQEFQPERLVALYSDHGAAEELWENEWTDHGYPSALNNGFMLLVSEAFRDRPKHARAPVADNTVLWASLSMSLADVNLPKFQKSHPPPRFLNDSFERVQACRSRELQLHAAAGPLSGESPVIRHIDPSKSVQENIDALGPAKCEEFLQACSSWLAEQEPRFEAAVAALVQSKSLLQAPGALWLFPAELLAVLAVLRGFARGQPPGATPGFGAGVAVIAAWYLFLVLQAGATSNPVWASCLWFLCGAPALVLAAVRASRLFQTRVSVPSLFEGLHAGFLAAVCVALASAIGAMKLAFLASRHFGLNKRLVYFLDKQACAAGLVLVVLAVLGLLRVCYTHSSVAASAPASRVRRWAGNLLNLAAASAMLACLCLYDAAVLQKQSLEQDQWQVALVRTFYLCYFAVALTSTVLLPAELEGRSHLVVAGFLMMCFWATNLSRILNCLIAAPLLAAYLGRVRDSKVLQSPAFVALAQVFLAGYFQACGEEYLFAVSQRAIKRYPVSHPDEHLGWTYTHIFFIKFCTALLVQAVMATSKAGWSLKEEAFCFAVNFALFVPYAVTIAATDRLKQSFLIFLAANVAVGAITLLLKFLAETVSTLFRLAPAPETSKLEPPAALPIDNEETQILV